MDIDRRVVRRYEVSDEDVRLWRPGIGELVRLRTWDVFARFLPPAGRVLDVGGGPGTHAAHLASRGYDVVLVDPVPRHVERAAGRGVDARLGVAHELPAADASVDVVLLMGPLYHLVERVDRLAALREAHRVLRPGGRLVVEAITRHAWLLDASRKGLLDDHAVVADAEWSVATGLSRNPDGLEDGGFWAWFHRPDDLRRELADAGFGGAELVAVEGFAWLLGGLEDRMAEPGPLLRVLRSTESEPSMLGCSAHVLGIADAGPA